MPKVLVTPDVLLNQVKRDAPRIAESFDKLCGADLEEISSLLAEGLTIVSGGMFHVGQDALRRWSVEALVNIANTLSASAYVLRAGYRLVPGVILRNAVEAMAVCLHGLQKPSDLARIERGDFDTPKAIGTARKVVPRFGELYGYLTRQFSHIGPLHHSIQKVEAFTSREPDLIVNLRAIRAAIWFYYVVAEFAFVDLVQSKRYWRLELPNGAVFDPSPAEKEWQEHFLWGPDPRSEPRL